MSVSGSALALGFADPCLSLLHHSSFLVDILFSTKLCSDMGIHSIELLVHIVSATSSEVQSLSGYASTIAGSLRYEINPN